MIRSFIVESTCNNMRIDRWLRNKLGKVPQSLIEKSLRLGKIKINKKKIKSSFKIKTNDKIELFNIDFKENPVLDFSIDDICLLSNIADLIIWDADPLEPSSMPEKVFINGKDIDLTSRPVIQ